MILFVETFIGKYLMSIAAASVAETVTYPLDLVKTRLQLQKKQEISMDMSTHAREVKYHGSLSMFKGIIVEEGFLRLWRGLSPSVLRHCIYSGLRVTIYENIRKFIQQRNNNEFSFKHRVVCGMTAGAAGQFFASPMDLVKVTLQNQRFSNVTRGYHICNVTNQKTATGVISVIQHKIQEAGFKSLWRGCLPNVQRAALVNLGDLTTYDQAKRMILAHTNLPDSSVVHALSSCCSGLVAASLGTPADVIKTRLMSQSHFKDGSGKMYQGSIDCLYKTVKHEGFFALYKGFVPIWMRMAPWSLTFWLTYEKIRSTLGVDHW